MNKAELIDRLSTRLGSRRDATLAVEALVDVVIREVASGGSVGITGFGTFERADRAPRTGRNPRTGESVPIAGTSTPRFRPGTYFKTVVTDPAELPADGLAGGRAPASTATPRKSAVKKTAAKKTAAKKATTRKATAGKKPAPAQLLPAEDAAAIESQLKDSAKKSLRKAQKADSRKAPTKKEQASKKDKAAKKVKGKSGKGAKKSK